MDFMTWLNSIPGIGPYLPYISAIISITAIIATVLPDPKDRNSVYAGFYRVIHWAALHLGQSKSAIKLPDTTSK